VRLDLRHVVGDVVDLSPAGRRLGGEHAPIVWRTRCAIARRLGQTRFAAAAMAVG
jgi:hypothetical protein